MEKKQVPPMGIEEFEEYLKENRYFDYSCVRRFKSIHRAIRRGNLTETGIIAPQRPFNNRANSSKRKGKNSRYTNQIKKEIHSRIKPLIQAYNHEN